MPSARDPALTPLNAARPHAPVEGLRVPTIAATADATLDHTLALRMQTPGHDLFALGRVQSLALQLARIQNGSPLPFDLLVFDAPQLVVFAADHGLADEGISDWPQSTSQQHVAQLLSGAAPANVLARQHGFDVTVVDAGLAAPIPPVARTRPAAVLQPRKIGYGTRNCLLGPAMSLVQAVSALHAGMDVVRHLPGTVIALGDIGVGGIASASLLLSRLCGVPVVDAFPREDPGATSLDDTLHWQRVDKLQAASQRHALAMSPIHALAAFGGFEIAMLAGAMLQAASERRIVLVDGFVAGAAALVARGLHPNVGDYLVYAQRSAAAPHRLMLIHLRAHPLLDLELNTNQGTGALLAWPLLLAAQGMLDATA
ncbi:MAG: nicotinate-nucleotide--dimethylbenzimidazole phosphoribosyltransferase [Hydrogenophaga sp.]|uniref:Nicotinate-nucleotide--dimethylbenzimidazole phosphoribosyltransferase n=1 Tax=Hydrogenophaga crocea TaxID=2716225 RepID=A0A6G8IN36_9BURK|nr:MULTISPECIES: nicotinate-nucleotide--dimethylbenzimidazole phosphoribosyltransferase [Hydrogenophaga]MBL0943209.1 nicotinate-nucleotide--dimethylbenzimidazole phosphoribosyltransferase [Hydrogenophaga sp.]QIM54390.1 nicotinate-nucleotide--dimethylbenzimidazole phosphoribosyltransferase [Hydrogenophaga crocea]